MRGLHLPDAAIKVDHSSGAAAQPKTGRGFRARQRTATSGSAPAGSPVDLQDCPVVVQVHGRTSPPVKDVPCQGALDEGGQPCLGIHGIQLLQRSCQLVSGAPACPGAHVNSTQSPPTCGGLQAGRIQLPQQMHCSVSMQALCRQAPSMACPVVHTGESSLLPDEQRVDQIVTPKHYDTGHNLKRDPHCSRPSASRAAPPGLQHSHAPCPACRQAALLLGSKDSTWAWWSSFYRLRRPTSMAALYPA